MSAPHGTGWAGPNRHRAAHDTRRRITHHTAKIQALEAEIADLTETIEALNSLIREDERLLEQLEAQTA